MFKNDPNYFYKYAKRLDGKQSSIGPLMEDGTYTADPKMIADML